MIFLLILRKWTSIGENDDASKHRTRRSKLAAGVSSIVSTIFEKIKKLLTSDRAVTIIMVTERLLMI